MRHKSVPGSQWPVASKFQVSCRPHSLVMQNQIVIPTLISSKGKDLLPLLLLRRCLLRRRFLPVRVGYVLRRLFPRPLRSHHFFAGIVRRLHLLLFLRKLGRFVRLPIKGNLGDADRGIVLPVSPQLFVLLLALVVEDQDLVAASLLDDFASYERSRPRRQNATRLGGNRQHIAELDLAVLVFLCFHPDYIARGYPILLSTCADHRVHKLSLYSCRDGAT